jgi:hypothetical protein
MAVLVVLGFMVLSFGTIGAAVVGMLTWVRKTHQKRLGTWGRVAQHHGLELTGSEIQGTKYGQRLRVCLVTRGSGNSRTTHTVVSAQLPMPLDLGLNLRRHGFLNDMFHASADIQLGDPAFDARFHVSADEEHRARVIFTPALRRLLFSRLGNNAFSLGDAGMSVECVGTISDEAWLSWAIEICARATHKMDAARQHTPPATPLLPHRNAWLDYARACGLQGQDTPLCMWGRIDRYDVWVHSVRVDRLRYAIQVQVRLPTPLGLGLSIKEIGMLDSVAIFLGGRDHRFGDPIFDTTFRVLASDPEGATAVLDETVRRELLWLRAHVGPPIVDDHGLSVRQSMFWHEPSLVPRVVHQLTGLAERLSARGKSAVAGPYR